MALIVGVVVAGFFCYLTQLGNGWLVKSSSKTGLAAVAWVNRVAFQAL